jgi:hypothetical protein
MKQIVFALLLVALVRAGEPPVESDQILTVLLQRGGVPDSLVTYALKLPRHALLNPETYLPESKFDYLYLEYDTRGNPVVAVIHKYVGQRKVTPQNGDKKSYNVWEIEAQVLFDLTKTNEQKK